LLIGVICADPKAKMDRVNQVLADLAEDKNEMIGYLRAKAISSLTNAAAQVFIKNADQILNGSFNVSLLDKAEAFESILKRIQKISVERIYNHDSVIKIELAGFRVMSGLIEDLVEAALTPAESRNTRQRKTLHLLPAQYRFEESISPYEKVMHMIDYVSGMTDIYALKLYKNLRGIEVPVI
jgi:dGTPase